METLTIHENMLIKFFTSSMERLENKSERFSNENTLLIQEVEILKTFTYFRNNGFKKHRELEEMMAREPMKEDIKLILKVLSCKIDPG